MSADLELVRATMNLLPAYVAYVDRDLRYVLANEMYMERFGLPQQNIVGQLVRDVTGPAFAEVEPFLRDALNGAVQHLEPQMVSVEGLRTLRVTHLPHRDGTGLVIGVIVHGFDITDQRRAERALVQSEKIAAVGRLASSIAHEINNPLESMTNLLYLAETTAPNDSAQTSHYVRLAQQELARVSQVTTQTLRFFRQSTARQQVSCATLVDSVLALYAGRLLNSGVVVRREYREDVLCECFELELRQSLNNLVSNALDAMRNHGGELQIRVRAASGPQGTGSGVRITVADNGSGMSPEVISRAFEAFFTTKGINGNGLGLWITRDLIEKEGGSIKVRSRESRGTVFTIYLPEPSP